MGRAASPGAIAEQGLEDTVGEGREKGVEAEREQPGPTARLGAARPVLLAPFESLQCRLCWVFIGLGGWQGDPHCEHLGVSEERDLGSCGKGGRARSHFRNSPLAAVGD